MLKGQLTNHLSGKRKIQEHTLIRTLDMVSLYVEDNFELAWGSSKKGVPHLKISGVKRNQPWFICVYSDDYFFGRVGSTYDVFDNPRKVIDFVRSRLIGLQVL